MSEKTEDQDAVPSSQWLREQSCPMLARGQPCDLSSVFQVLTHQSSKRSALKYVNFLVGHFN